MNRVLKMCFVWLLLIALPLQGFASATMYACGTDTDQHGAAAAATEAVMVEMAGHCDPAAHAKMAAADTVTADTVAADASDSASSGHDCKSGCQACQAGCVGAMLVSGSSDWKPAPAVAELPRITPQVFISGHIPGGLERPPRVLLS
jgi:hypothetical protein